MKYLGKAITNQLYPEQPVQLLYDLDSFLRVTGDLPGQMHKGLQGMTSVSQDFKLGEGGKHSLGELNIASCH